MEAVAHPSGPLLVLAGAGTGKTRVLVQRIAQLVQWGTSPREVLAVTFTNKAAGEMRGRLRELLGAEADAMWLGTFHSICARLLRRHADYVGLTRQFQVFDDDDQMKLVTRLLKDTTFENEVSPRSFLARLDRAKNRGVPPTELKLGTTLDEAIELLYPKYQAQLIRENAVDFGDLLLHVRALQEHPVVGRELARQFRHVLVDEFQDTNLVQYELVRAWAKSTGNLTVVGDDDQSIYGWRGAEPRNLLDFARDYPDAALVRLEQNYRSTSVILDAANALISNNRDRLGKSLWTEQAGGEPIVITEVGDERAEALVIANTIRQLIADGPYSPRDMAVLYRTNAQSRVVEEHLRAARIPARVVGALSFFERKEIKDVIGYLRLVQNEAADSAFLRVVNSPTRGIGDTTVDRLRQAAGDAMGLLAAARMAVAGESGMAAGPRRKLAVFTELIADLQAVVQSGASLGEIVIQVVERTGMRSRLEAQGDADATDRLGNLAELVSLASDYDEEMQGEGNLDEFLERIALSSPAEALDASADAVTLMTIHIAKGLEFPVVFLTGLEDGLFPSVRERDGQSEDASAEEERRLAYVAMTRARERLYLSWARTRRVWGEIRLQDPSRFLLEVPSHLCQRPKPASRETARALLGRMKQHDYDEFDQRSYDDVEDERRVSSRQVSSDDGNTEPDLPTWVGRVVKHIAFGSGRVLEMHGDGKRRALVVEFPVIGKKEVLAKYVQPVD